MSGMNLDIRCSGSGGFRLDIRCQLPPGSATAIYGPSGSGKTTLLECVAGLRQDDLEGSIHFGDQGWLDGGHSVPTWRRRRKKSSP